ncbi:MAG: hypothetical protein WC178_02580 [Candidatus Paceibacterota bacterium]
MENSKTMTPVNVHTDGSLESFKQGVDNLLAKRSYFISQVFPKLQEGQDYYIIKGKKSLAKGGAEKLASIYSLTASFNKDTDTLEMLGHAKGLIAFVCTLTRSGVIVGQGRGAYMVDGDPNKAIKMAQKRSFTDSIVRTTGLSDIFTTDLEDMDPAQIIDNSKEKGDKYQTWITDLQEESNVPIQREEYVQSDNHITEKQKKLLVSLINRKVYDEEQRETLLNDIDSLDKSEASQYIKEFIEQ